MKFTWIICLTFVMSGAPASLRASRISFRMEPSSRLQAGIARISLKAVNTGNEAAELVRAEAEVAGYHAESRTIKSLEPGKSATFRMSPGKFEGPPGIHTALITLHWVDPQGYPFSALKSIPLITAVPDPPRNALSLSVERAELSNS